MPYINVSIVRSLYCIALCFALAGCYFLEGGGTPFSVVERNLLSDINCLQTACWEAWTPGETELSDLEASRRFSEPDRWFETEYVDLEGVGNDADITAIVDTRTNRLARLIFNGPYPLLLRDVIDTLGPPAFFEGSYRSTMVVDPRYIGDLFLYYPARGYSFLFYVEAKEENPVQICFTGDEPVHQMSMYASGTIEEMIGLAYPINDASNMEIIKSRLLSYFGYGCIRADD